MSWRDVLPIHPAAEMVEAATNEERRVLRGDLKQHGQREPVVLVRIGQGCEQLLDGRTRLDLQEANGDDVIGGDGKLTVPHRIVELPDDAAAISYVLSLNLFRRHLTPKQKRELIDKLLKAMPEKSNRQIAKTVGVSHPHVAKVRKALEKSGDVETVTTSVDTKGRKQPAKKAKKAKQPAEKKSAKSESEPIELVKPIAAAASRGDIGADSVSELARLRARNAKLEIRVKELEAENAALRAKLEAVQKVSVAASSERTTVDTVTAGDPEPKLKVTDASNGIALGDALARAFGELGALGCDCRQQVDNAPAGLDQSDRINTLDDTASVLEELEAPDVPAELAEIKIALPKFRKPRSRSDRLDVELNIIDACVKALDAISESDPRHQAAHVLRNTLEEASTAAEECAFQ